ncbi:MAG: hypothetical protein Tsb0020_41570 [Haliangiales bacterium]
MYREIEIGQTVLGRPIGALHFTPPSYAKARPPAVMVAALHGDEPLGTHCLGRLCGELVERPPGRETWIVPALNVDGLAAGSKNNANDVDLDRNFAASDWSREYRPGYRSGSEPESEPELQALSRLIADSGAERLLALYSPYRALVWSGSGRALATEMAALSGYELRDDLGHPTPGSFDAKYGRDQQLECVRLEIPFVEEEEAWLQNRAALRHAVDLRTRLSTRPGTRSGTRENT